MWFWYGLMPRRRDRTALYKDPDLARPYWMWGYPVTPALFVAIACWFLVNMLNTRPLPSVGEGLSAIQATPRAAANRLRTSSLLRIADLSGV
jgi:hypothetical protein